MNAATLKKWAPVLDYSLRRRLFDRFGHPLPWQDHGRGTYFDIKIVQKQIDLLTPVGRKVEIEFIHKKNKLDYYGYPTKTNLIFNDEYLDTDAP